MSPAAVPLPPSVLPRAQWLDGRVVTTSWFCPRDQAWLVAGGVTVHPFALAHIRAGKSVERRFELILEVIAARADQAAAAAIRRLDE